MSENGPLDVLFYAEDPGAANYVAGLPVTCSKAGLTCRILAQGKAVDILRQQGVACEHICKAQCPDELLEAVEPRCVAIGTSENAESWGHSLIAAARRKSLPSMGLVDGISNSAYRFRGVSDDPLAHVPGWLIVPDERTRAEYVRLGMSPERIVPCGHPHYDHVRDEANRLTGMGKALIRARALPALRMQGQKVVLFATELSDGLNSDQFARSDTYSLHGRGDSTQRTFIVLEEFLDALAGIQPRPFLILRLHPKNKREEFAVYANEFDVISDSGSPMELVFAVDAVVGMTTMLLQEAVLLGRPTLSILPREEEKAWLPTIRGGLTACATTRRELRSIMPRFLSDPAGCCPGHLEECFVFGAAARVLSLIERLIALSPGVSRGV